MKMHERYQNLLLIILILNITESTDGEERKLLTSKMLYETAIKKYPALIHEDVEQTIVENPRRFGGWPWFDNLDDNARFHNYWFRNLQTFAHDLQYWIKVGSFEDKVRTCHMIATTTLGASTNLRRYFDLRYLYIETIDYEIGYMTHEIIAKYQRLLETFYIVRKKFFYQRKKYKAPIKYMFYMYTNILELSHVIIHLCNMYHEIRYKYGEEPGSTVFSDSPVEQPIRALRIDGFGNMTYEELQQKIALMRKQRKKRLRMQRKEWPKYSDFTPLPRVTPYKSSRWPLTYGWSIEDW